MDIYQLCRDQMNIDPAQFYNSSIAVIASLIAGQLLLFCACMLLLRRLATSSPATAPQSTFLAKIKAICMHGIISSKGCFSVDQFRQVFLLVLAPAR